MLSGLALIGGLRLALGMVVTVETPVARVAPLSRVWLEVSSDSASPRCASEGEIAARVAVRSPRILFTHEPTATHHIEARVTEGPSGVVSSVLTFSEPGGGATVRRVQTQSCLEAIDVVALIIAVALDPTDATPPPREGTPPSRPSRAPESARTAAPNHTRIDATSRNGASAMPPLAPASAATTDTNKREAVPPVIPTTVPTTVPAALPPPAPATTPAPSPSGPNTTSPASPPQVASTIVWDAGLGALALRGPAPGMLPGLSLSLGVEKRADATWPWRASLGLLRAWRHDFRETGGTASFALDAAVFGLCPTRLRLAALEVHACAASILGRLQASGSETNDQATVRRPYAALGASVALSWAIGKHWYLMGDAGAGLTLLRDSFEFAPFVFHRASLLTTWVALGIALHLP